MSDAITTIGPKLAPYNPTNLDAIHSALTLLHLTQTDILYDLGCGDGRVLIEGVKRYGLHAVGVEYDKSLCERAQANLLENNISRDQAVIYHANVMDVNFSDATAIFVYLVPAGMAAIRDRLLEAMQRGVRIVTYVFSIPDLAPEQKEDANCRYVDVVADPCWSVESFVSLLRGQCDECEDSLWIDAIMQHLSQREICYDAVKASCSIVIIVRQSRYVPVEVISVLKDFSSNICEIVSFVFED